MNKELRELYQDRESKKTEMRALLEADRVEEAKSLQDELRTLNDKISMLEDIEKEEREMPTNPTPQPQNTEYRDVFVKLLRGHSVTTEERALVKGTPADGGYLVPEEYDARIREFMREYRAARNLVGLHTTNVTSGSFVFEDLATITPLADMTEMTDLTEQKPKFSTKTYAVKDYGALLPISNTLLQDEQADLMGYIGRWFAKKAVRTENAKIFAALKAAKSATAVADWKALKSLINKQLDPLVAANSIIMINQDAFDVLDAALDGNGRPVLQPDPTNPTQRRFMGLTVHVFSNAELVTTGTTTKKAPIFIGAMSEAVKFIDRGVFEMATSTDFGFGKNATYVRCIERFDVLVTDKDAYINGEITVS